jgi:LCP family protein required for cell wall assembly
MVGERVAKDDSGKSRGAAKAGAGSGKPRRRKAPLWARLCAVFGIILMVVSGGTLVTSQVLVARYAGAVDNQDLFGDAAAAGTKKSSDIKGPVNILLAGIDPRDTKTAPLSDSIIVVHVTKSMDEAYMFSIPRDLVVDIPAYAKTNYPGGRGKINSAMSFGSRRPDGSHDVRQGFGLLAKTVSQLTGIKEFDAGAIVNFGGFKKIVDAMGGVTMTIDQDIKSEHLQPNGKPRPKLARCADNGCAHPYYGPQKLYKKGTHELEGWEALDLVRQRYGVEGGDYGRQKNQQAFIKAMAKQALSKNVVSNPAMLDRVLKAAGQSLTFDGQGHNVVDWGLALKNVRPENMTSIKLPGGSLMVGGQYRGEALADTADEFFASLSSGTVGTFLLSHPEFVNSEQ